MLFLRFIVASFHLLHAFRSTFALFMLRLVSLNHTSESDVQNVYSDYGAYFLSSFLPSFLSFCFLIFSMFRVDDAHVYYQTHDQKCVVSDWTRTVCFAIIAPASVSRTLYLLFVSISLFDCLFIILSAAVCLFARSTRSEIPQIRFELREPRAKTEH